LPGTPLEEFGPISGMSMEILPWIMSGFLLLPRKSEELNQVLLTLTNVEFNSESNDSVYSLIVSEATRRFDVKTTAFLLQNLIDHVSKPAGQK
jgi:uncharacterized membrane protein